MTISRRNQKKKVRIRRSPQDARALILASAETVLAARGPDAVGLKEVAREAGVSHALVTHYFGTYEALVKAVLERRMELARVEAERVIAVAPPGPENLLSVFFALLSDPLHVRLTTWALLSARQSPMLTLQAGAIAPLLEVIRMRREREYGPQGADPEDVALDVTLALAAGYGFALGGELFAHAMNRKPFTMEVFSRRLAAVLRRPQLSKPGKGG